VVPTGTRTLDIVDVGRHLLDETLDPPIAALFIYNHNPVCTHPDQNRLRRGLAREDLFVVGADVVMTDSMRYCDVVLPAASSFEHDDLYAAYGTTWLQRAAPVIAPVDEALPNTEIFRRLAARFGFDESLFRDTDADLMDAAIDATDPRLQGHAGSDVPLEVALSMRAAGDAPLLMCDTVLPATRTGKVELFSQDLEDRYGYGVPRYEPVPARLPLLLISPSSSRRTNTTFGGDPASLVVEEVEVNPADALARGIETGQPVRVWNTLGEVRLMARISDAVAPGVLYSAKGTWLETSASGQTVNALIDADLKTDIAAGACYNDTAVEIAVL